MAKNKVAELLNEQVTKEFYSAYLYLDFANYYNDKGLKGYQNWFEVQAQEEMDHALLFIKYMQQNDMPVTLEAIDKPNNKFDNFIDPLKASLAHEQYVTGLIHKIYGEAQKANDFRCTQFLDWFVKEQGEEEDNARTNIQRAELFGNDPKALYQLDQEMQTRVYAAPTLVI
ncbi:MAG: ferritin [Eubacterium sp.]|nr:ferritin [Eubacterium sp.]